MTTQRARRRGKAEVQAKYDAAGTARRAAGWRPPQTGPNRAMQGLATIRSRAQDAVRNDWSGESSVQKWSTTLVGVGIVPRWEDDQVTELWTHEFVPNADADDVLDYYGQQTLAVREWLADGEVFIRRRPRSLSLGLAVPLQIQIIPSAYCPLLDTNEWPGLPPENIIRSGIELTRFGDKVAYWMFKDHPQDSVAKTPPSQTDLVRVPASDIRHVFEPKRAGQLRGVSNLAPVLMRLRSTADFEDAVLDRQKLANLFTLFITRAMPDKWDDLDLDPDTGLPKFYDSDGQPMAALEPGLAQELKPGEDVKFANPPEAGVTFSDYLRTTMLGTASGQGLPYELFSGDIQNVSDRTLRVVIQEFRRFAEQRQWQIIIPKLCQPVVEWFVSAAVLAGRLPMAKAKAAKRPTHNPHGWEYIHPVQDVQGKILAINARLTSRAAVITARGDDAREVEATILAEAKADRDNGFQPVGQTPTPEPATGPGGKPPPAPQVTNQAPDFAPILAAMTQMMTGMQALVGQFAALQASSSAAQPAAAPVIHNHLPAPVVNVAPTEVRVEGNEIHIPAPIVNVAPAEVRVDNNLPAPVVNVAPATVEVVNNMPAPEVTVNLPERETRSVIKRNAQGDIVDVTQTERTLN